MGQISLGRELSFRIMTFTGCLFLLTGMPIAPAHAITEPPVAPQTAQAANQAAAKDNPMCDKNMKENIGKQVERMMAVKNGAALKNLSPPPPPSAVANSPCMSAQMESIANQFSYAPSNYGGQVLNGVTGNPVGSVFSGVFRSGYNSIFTDELKDKWPSSASLQNKFGVALAKLIPGLNDSPFAKDVCGLMLDSLLNYIQCESNFSLPSLTIPSFSIPGSCGAQTARNAAYQAANKQSFDILNQKPSASLPKSVPTNSKP